MSLAAPDRGAAPRLRPLATPQEAQLARSISYFIGNRRNRGHTIDEVMMAIDAKWPAVSFKLVLTAFCLEQARRGRLH